MNEELNFEAHRRYLKVFRSRWAPLVLLELHKGPQQRANLAQTIVDEGKRISDGVLSEVLNRLQAMGLVVKDPRSANEVFYEASEEAQEWYEWLQDINQVTARAAARKEADVADDAAGRGPKIDMRVPSSARVWNYFLGGKDNFDIDREVAEQVRAVHPALPTVALEQRRFLQRAVTYLAADCSVRQFLDIGTGLPTANSTHEVAQQIAPSARIVYVDNDPLVLVHARALLTSHPEGATAYIDSDVRIPDKILREAARTLDFSRPTALIMTGILGNVVDYIEARAIVDRLTGSVSAGSFLVVSDGTDTSPAAVQGQRIASEAGHPYNLRTPQEITGYFYGLELVEPGVVTTSHWRPESDPPPPALDCYCGVAVKR